MKNILLITVFCCMFFAANAQFIIHKVIKKQKEGEQKKEQNIPPLDSNAYKTYSLVKYSDLPSKIKILMDSLGCGKIGAVPDLSNETKNNMDCGYSIDLNDDRIPEYIFCCFQVSHDSCKANIYSNLKGSWRLIMKGFNGCVNKDPAVNIKVLQTVHEGFHDLYRKDRILVFKDGFYQ